MKQPGGIPTQVEAEGAPRSVESSSGPASAANAGQSARPIVPDYELLRRIGGGAYGEVWLARSKATGALRAAKVVWRHTFEDERPFRREFEGIQSFEEISRQHPSQLALFHIGRNDAEGYFYYVMELADDVEVQSPSTLRSGATAEEVKSKVQSPTSAVQGTKSKLQAQPAAPTLDIGNRTLDSGSYVPHTLRADLANGRLPASRVLEIGLALTEALSHLHLNGLVHRDVKPSNVIFVNGRPKLADIGLVTDASDQCSIVGTEGYLPPEGPGAPQADIFALGKVLYEAATGLDRRRFPDLPQELRSWPDTELATELNEIVLKACALNVHERYSGAGMMLADLQLLQGGKSVKRSRVVQSYWAAARKAGIGLAGLGALAVAVAVFLRGRSSPDSYPDGPDSTNVLAQRDCERGMAIVRNDEYDRFGEAYTYFTNAIARDPNFARPRVGLLEMATRDFRPGSKVPAQEERRQLAVELKRLAPNLAATSVAQSIISFFEWRFEAAEDFELKAIAANPKYEMAHTTYAYMLTCWGRPDEALLQLTNSINLRRTKAIVHRCIGDAYYAKRDLTNAIEWYNHAIDLDPHESRNFHARGRALWANKDYPRALDDFEEGHRLSAPNESVRSKRKDLDDTLRKAFDRNGERGYWQQWGNEVDLNPDQDPAFKAWVLIHIPERTDEALGLLAEAAGSEKVRAHESVLTYLLLDYAWDGVRHDRRFTNVLDTLGFTKMMRPGKK